MAISFEQCKGIAAERGAKWQLLIPGSETIKDDKPSFRVRAKVRQLATNWRVLKLDFDTSLQEIWTAKRAFTLKGPPIEKGPMKGHREETRLEAGARGKLLFGHDQHKAKILKRIWFDNIGLREVPQEFYEMFTSEITSSAWQQISGSKACQRNDEGLAHFDSPSDALMTLRMCQEICEGNDRCNAVDFYHGGGVCLLYETACLEPKADWSHASSWRKVGSSTPVPSPISPPLPQPTPQPSPPVNTPSPVPSPSPSPPPDADDWVAIDENAACQGNDEGITHTWAAPGFTLESCKEKCIGSCVAIDFYRERRNWCLTYDRVCSNPRRTVAGASSWKKVSNSKHLQDCWRGCGREDKADREYCDFCGEHLGQKMVCCRQNFARGAEVCKDPDIQFSDRGRSRHECVVPNQLRDKLHQPCAEAGFASGSICHEEGVECPWCGFDDDSRPMICCDPTVDEHDGEECNRADFGVNKESMEVPVCVRKPDVDHGS